MVEFPPINSNNSKIALVAASKDYSYQYISTQVERFATGLLAGKADLNEERIAFLIPASLDYVITLHGIWRAGGIAVPLSNTSAEAELEHYLASTKATRVIANDEQQNSLGSSCKRFGISMFSVEDILSDIRVPLPNISATRRAMILFTSGTTGKPKGVVTTHKAIRTQITTLVEAWEWQPNDVIPLFLPLHHVHGIINVLSCALWIGATVHLMPKLEIPTLLDEVAANTYTVFMAVPTIYVKLLQYIEQLKSQRANDITDGFNRMRLNVSGSAACPVTLFEQWQQLTGQTLLERYGMTEIGMAISNPYVGERRAGYVGTALPGVNVALFDGSNRQIVSEASPGEIRVKGDSVFLEYWGDEKSTSDSFIDSWFRTGDTAIIEDGYFRIMGRTSIDIIKSGGYKLSALEIEGLLLTHTDVLEAAIIGTPDATWGEIVTAIVVLKTGCTLNIDELKHWCAGKISPYKIPKKLTVVDALPRNAMGKVTKTALAKLF